MQAVEDLVARLFGAEGVDDDSSPETVEGWDSMGHLNLVLALERDYQVSIAVADVVEMVSVKRIKDVLRGYGVGL